MKKRDKIYGTADFALAITLSTLFQFRGLERTGDKRAVFLFSESARLIKAVDAYYASRIRVEPKQFYEASRRLKAVLYNA